VTDRYRRLLDGLIAVVGFGALTLAGLVAYAPGLVPVGTIASVLSTGTTVLLVGGGTVALVAMVTHRTLFEEDEDDTTVRIPTPPAAVERDRSDVDTAGDWIDDRLSELRGDEDDAESSRYDSVVESRVVQRVRDLAVDVVAEAESCSEREAHDMLASGTWTDRPRARVLLGDDVPGLPLRVRFVDWASGEAFDRQVRATVEELAAIAAVDLEVTLAPERVETDDEDPWVSRTPETDPDLPDAGGDGFYRPDMFDDDGSVADLDLEGDPDGGVDTEADIEHDSGATAAGGETL
jgi:hypothetical protein